MKQIFYIATYAVVSLLISCSNDKQVRKVDSFNSNWVFKLGNIDNAYASDFNDSAWRKLDLPHDWSIEGSFSEEHPATAGGGALPGGIGWYRKTFRLDESQKDRAHYVQFDGVYMNSEVWINGQYLGKRPFGYISFEYDLTPYLHYGDQANVIAVKVDNSRQPNSRWYSGSGIYRNVRLVTTSSVHVRQWGTYITSDKKDEETYKISFQTDVTNKLKSEVRGKLITRLFEGEKEVKTVESDLILQPGGNAVIDQSTLISNPHLWDINDPFLYKAVSQVVVDGLSLIHI